MHQTCLVLWTWRKLANETNAKNAHKICQDYPYVKNEYNAHHSHLSHKNDYPGARDDCQHLAVIPHTRTAVETVLSLGV